MELQGKLVLITGASRGIGQALARGFAADGARVVNFARSAPITNGAIDNDPDQMLTVLGDVSAQADVEQLISTVHERFGRIDILVNNAALLNQGPFLSRPFKEWEEVIRVNLLGLAFCTYCVLPGMIQRGCGRVINVVSRAADLSPPTLSAYAASKAAAVSLTRALAAEIGPPTHPDILINALVPGPTDTTLARDAGHSPSQTQPPEAVYPHTKFLATLPAGGPHGRVFWNSEEYRPA